MKKKIIAAILTVILGVTITACSNKKVATTKTKATEKKVVTLGFPGTHSTLFGVALIAQNKKYFEKELEKVGYKIEYVPFAAQGPAVNEALASKKINLAIYADFPGIVLKSKGVNIDLLGITEDKIYSTVVVKNGSNIKSIKDLKGKKIGFTKGTYMQKFLMEILNKNGISQNDVQLVNVSTDAESALVSGNLDALVLTDSQALQLIDAKKVAKPLVSSREYPKLSAQMVFVGAEGYAKDNSKAIVAMDKALIEAQKYFKENPEDSYKILTESGLGLETVRNQYKGAAPNFDLFTIGINKDSISRINETEDFMLKNKLISNKFDASKWADNSYYEKAIK